MAITCDELRKKYGLEPPVRCGFCGHLPAQHCTEPPYECFHYDVEDCCGCTGYTIAETVCAQLEGNR